VAYAITSYQCAWFLTYYPDEWVTTYIDYCATSKGKVTGKEDPVSIALKEAKRLGYTMSKADINLSEYEFTLDSNKKRTLVPSFASLKHVGKSVMYELRMFRPYKTAHDLLINPNGSWRHSKLNKRSLSTLIKLEALGSMDLVGEGKMFDNYKQMHSVFIDNYDKLKSMSAKKKNNDIKPVVAELVHKAKLEHPEDWTRLEKVDAQRELAGSVDFDLLVDPEVQAQLLKEGIPSIDNWESDEDGDAATCWAIVTQAVTAVTKTGKPYLKIRLMGEASKEHTCFIWNYRARGDSLPFKQNDVVVAKMKHSDFGFSAFPNQIVKLNPT